MLVVEISIINDKGSKQKYKYSGQNLNEIFLKIAELMTKKFNVELREVKK